jgi:hypothetical protein
MDIVFLKLLKVGFCEVVYFRQILDKVMRNRRQWINLN